MYSDAAVPKVVQNAVGRPMPDWARDKLADAQEKLWAKKGTASGENEISHMESEPTSQGTSNGGAKIFGAERDFKWWSENFPHIESY